MINAKFATAKTKESSVNRFDEVSLDHAELISYIETLILAETEKGSLSSRMVRVSTYESEEPIYIDEIKDLHMVYTQLGFSYCVNCEERMVTEIIIGWP
jgi:hypothetical protein